MKMIRKGPSGWHNQEGEETTDLLGSGGDKLAIQPNLGGAFEWPKHRSGINSVDRVGLEEE
jgi:hypothetical protein